MIRRALTITAGALFLTAGLAGCGESGPTPEETAVEFMTVFQEGDKAAACELADRKIGDCTTRPSLEFETEPVADESFENEDTGTTAVVVTYTIPNDSVPRTWAVEITAEGKVTQWEEMSGQPKNRETVAMVLDWAE